MLPNYEESIHRVALGDYEWIHCVVAMRVPGAPVVVIPTQFEKTIRTNAFLMATFIQNGINVVRFDFRNHIGESSGDIQNYRLSDNIEDLRAVFENLPEFGFAHSQSIGLVGTSLANRTSLRFLAGLNAPRVQWYGSFLGVVNVESTIGSVMDADVIGDKRKQPQVVQGLKKAVKYEISADSFAQDCLEHQLGDLQGTKDDLKGIDGTPVAIVLSEQDNWVSYPEAVSVYSDYRNVVHRFVLPNGGHLLDKNLVSARESILALVRSATQVLGVDKVDETKIQVPLTVPELISLNQRERLREAKTRSSSYVY